ncbi:TPR-like protein [Serendipita vermifera]|nr:TPR-like protein [Serendipita vermifera]
MKQSKKHISGIGQFLALASNPALGVASPSLLAALQPDNLAQFPSLQVDRTDLAINSSITSFKAIKEVAEAVPQVGGPIKATCGVMILALETIRKCNHNRDGWRELAEIIQDKNQRVTSLLGLYAQAPDRYADVLEQANKYQELLNEIASDMKVTESKSEKRSGLEGYLEGMKICGREAALSEINAKKIADYKERLRDQTLSTTEVVGIQIIGRLHQIEKQWVDQAQENPPSSRTVIFKPRPPLVKGFVGRNDILEAIGRTHFETTSAHQTTPRVTVLTGLGGCGKTQIALKFASQFEEKYKGGSVYFLDASSKATLETDLNTLVQSQSDVYTDALLWLASKPRDWLIIMDNADDPLLEIATFLPRCTHGHVVITTRNRLHELLAPKTTYYVDSLSLSDSITLLLDSSGYQDNRVNRQLSEKIAQELGCLPLALAHAGAYILLRQCLDTYLERYRESCSQLLGRKFSTLHNYPHSIATTIEMSFQKLSTRVQDLLVLLSHLDTTSIPRSIIEKAANRHFRYVEMETDAIISSETIQYADLLSSIICPQGAWSEHVFDDLIEECENYSLVRHSTQNGERFYSIHVLVQTFLQSTYRAIHGYPSRRLVTRFLGSAITTGTRYEYFPFNRLLLSHLRLVDVEDVIEAGDHYGYGAILQEMGEGWLAVSHMERCLDMWSCSLNEESEPILKVMEMLAHSYSITGNEESALILREEVMKKRRVILGEDHLDTLWAIGYLTLSYSNLRRDEEALPLKRELVEKVRMLLGEDHLHTLLAISNLAMSYSNLGRDEKAMVLQEEVLEKQIEILGKDHPDTLMTIHSLAGSYYNLQRYEEALPLQEEVWERRKRLFGDDHPDTLQAMGNIATSYSSLGRKEEALPLEEQVLEKRRRLFGDDHLDTLQAFSNLAASYSNLGRKEEALPLYRMVMEKHRRLLGDNHLDTLQAVNDLAIAYSNLGRNEEALPLHQEVVEKRRRLLGDGHLDTLQAVNGLAISYSNLGRNEEALSLHKMVVETRRRVLGDNHLDTLHAISNLAISYSNLEREEVALPLAEDLVKKQMALLGEEHPYTLDAMDILANIYAALGQDKEALRLQTLISSKQSNSQRD